MKDYLGNELLIGDRVAYIDNHYKYTLMKGVITKLGEKQATIITDCGRPTYKFYAQMIKIRVEI